MATQTGSYVADNSTLANFQAWTMAIFNAFTGFGWLQTSDTGQAATPPAAVPSSAYVYWIFRANDAQAATLPIFIKLEIGNASGTVAIRLTIGTGSNGSGTITGNISLSAQTVQAGPLASQGAPTYPCYFSGDAGEIRVLMWATNLALAQFFMIERSKDSGGNKTTEYFTIVTHGGNSLQIFQQSTPAPLTLPVGPKENWNIVCTTNSAASGTGFYSGTSTVAAYPVFPCLGKIGNPMIGMMSCCAGDVAEGATVSVLSVYGSTHTYIAWRHQVAGSSTAQSFARAASNGSTSALLMRYE